MCDLYDVYKFLAVVYFLLYILCIFFLLFCFSYFSVFYFVCYIDLICVLPLWRINVLIVRRAVSLQ